MSMKTSKAGRKVAGVALMFVAILILLSSMPSSPTTQNASGVDKAPDWTLKDTDGNNWTLREFEGKKVVLIDFMSLSCHSCEIVEDNLQKVYPDYKDKDVFIISVDVFPDDTEQKLRDHKNKNDIPWSMALDKDDLLTKYGVTEIAKVIIIDKKGYAVYENTGVTSEEELREKLDAALKEELKPIDINPLSLWVLAIFAGVASFFSPCAFPMFPGYMTFYFKKHMEQADKELKVGKAAASGSVTAAGIILVYIIIGAAILLAGTVIVPFISALQLVIGILLLILGALMMTNIQYDGIIAPFRKIGNKLKGKKKDKPGTEKKGDGFYAGLFVYGAGYGGAAAACTLPVFLGVILGGISTGNFFTGILLLMVYTLVAAVLMIVVTVALAVVGHKAVQKIAQYTTAIKKISGLVLLLAGVYLVLFWLISSGHLTLPW
jgi:cytochrome c-type biogenesis protein